MTSTLSPPNAPSPPPPVEIQPGTHGIRGKRSWKTWQVIVACVISLLLGMRLGYDGESSTKAIAGGTVPGGSGLPPDPNAGSSTTLPPDPGADPGAEPGSDPGSDPGADAGPGDPAGDGTTESSAPGSGTAQLLLEITPHTGSSKSETFKVAAGGWKLGWSFNCSKQGGTGNFAIAVQRPDGTEIPDDPPVGLDDAQGTGVQDYTSDGEHVLAITTDCLWALKVTGIPG